MSESNLGVEILWNSFNRTIFILLIDYSDRIVSTMFGAHAVTYYKTNVRKDRIEKLEPIIEIFCRYSKAGLFITWLMWL